MLSLFSTWLIDKFIPIGFGNAWAMFIDLVNELIKAISTGIVYFAEKFPENDFTGLISGGANAYDDMSSTAEAMLSTGLHALAWLVPVGYICDLVACVLIAVASYFFLAPVLRWFKLLT